MKKKLCLLILLIVLVFPLIVNAEDVDKIEARKNLDAFSSFAYAIDPTYMIEAEDIKIVMKSPNTKFAIGIGLNSTYKVTSTDKEYLRKNPNTLFAYALSQNSNYGITTEDKSYLDKNSNTLFAFGLSRNPSYNSKENNTNKKDESNKSIAVKSNSRYEDGSRFLFTSNFKSWLTSKGVIAPPPLSSGYGQVTDFLMTPLDLLEDNFHLFDFFHSPISQWTGWSIIHAFIVMSFLSVLFVPRKVPNK